LSIRRECARDLGMYDLRATKSEDVDLCFRMALSPRWVAWREDGADVQHKGRASLGALLRQMWGWGFHLGYPYAKIGMRGFHAYWLSARTRNLGGSLEVPSFPILTCVFGSEFHVASALAVVLLLAVATGHPIVVLAALIALVWAARGYMYDVMDAGLGRTLPRQPGIQRRDLVGRPAPSSSIGSVPGSAAGAAKPASDVRRETG